MNWFALALELKMTVEELKGRMSLEEMQYWLAYSKIRNDKDQD
jgi:hypothetical protein